MQLCAAAVPPPVLWNLSTTFAASMAGRVIRYPTVPFIRCDGLLVYGSLLLLQLVIPEQVIVSVVKTEGQGQRKSFDCLHFLATNTGFVKYTVTKYPQHGDQANYE